MTETPTERAARAYWRMSEMPNCRICGRFVSLAKLPVGWFAHGEFGEDTSYVCRRCVPNWKPEDGKGRGPEAGYCGVMAEPEHSLREKACEDLDRMLANGCDPATTAVDIFVEDMAEADAAQPRKEGA